MYGDEFVKIGNYFLKPFVLFALDTFVESWQRILGGYDAFSEVITSPEHREWE